jgi:hypothetical protein
VATLDDIAAANRLAHETLGRCLDEMPPQTRRLLLLVEQMVAARCAASKMEREDVRFTRRELREASGWSNTQVHVHLTRLLELEYVLAHRADHGAGQVYELAYDGGGKDGGRFVSGLLEVEKLRAAHGYDGNRSGVGAASSGSIRGAFGPSSGPLPHAENAALSSENGVSKNSARENARPTAGENAAA